MSCLGASDNVTGIKGDSKWLVNSKAFYSRNHFRLYSFLVTELFSVSGLSAPEVIFQNVFMALFLIIKVILTHGKNSTRTEGCRGELERHPSLQPVLLPRDNFCLLLV